MTATTEALYEHLLDNGIDPEIWDNDILVVVQNGKQHMIAVAEITEIGLFPARFFVALADSEKQWLIPISSPTYFEDILRVLTKPVRIVNQH